jgi:hypothetical protein
MQTQTQTQTQPNSQSQSPLFHKLSRELRDLIYREVWRTHGLRQHIIWHGHDGAAHFCHWPCQTPFDPGDALQRDAAAAAAAAGDHDSWPHERALYARRMQSPWMSHWACGEDAARRYGRDGVLDRSMTSLGHCWKTNPGAEAAPASPYLPMLLTCKAV